jgi:PAS domain S-box-containing protein
MELLGYTPEEYIGQPIMKFCPDDEEVVLKIFHELATGKSIQDVPVRFRSKSGRIKHLLIDSNVNWNVDGSFKHTRCFIRDDTRRQIREARHKLAEEKALQAAHQNVALLRKVCGRARRALPNCTPPRT